VSTFKHYQTAHCENGVTLGLLKNIGINPISEPLIFGIGSGLFYIHVPFMKVHGAPTISFRSFPGAIFKRTCDALDIKVERRKFSSPEKAQRFLDEKLSENIPVGCQVGVFNLSYFPKEYRFHFNAHNLIVYGKNGGNEYLISDPVMEEITTLDQRTLEKVRFAKGILAPKGQIYYPIHTNELNKKLIQKGIKKGIKRTINDMIALKMPFIGVRGIKYTANQIEKWPSKVGERKAKLFLGQIVRMQEEIGTGGGGFRYIYAAFLKEAAQWMEEDFYDKASEKIHQAGNLWRESAVLMAGIYKGRLDTQKDYQDVANILREISQLEKKCFLFLKKHMK